MPFVVSFFVSWIVFYVFADRSKWRSYLPACFLAMLMSISTDTIVLKYPLWTYHDPTGLLVMNGYTHFLDDLGIYPVVTYLFLQYFPTHKHLLHKFLYFVMWTTFAISLELFYHVQGWMEHRNGWSHWHSYAADWVLLYLLLAFHNLYNKSANPVSVAPSYVHEIRQLGLELEFIAEAEDYEVYLLEVHPGGQIIPHWHNSNELCVVLKGQLEFTIGETTAVYSEGNLITLPKEVTHCGQNAGSESALLLCAFWPAGLKQSLQTKTLDQLASTMPPVQL